METRAGSRFNKKKGGQSLSLVDLQSRHLSTIFEKLKTFQELEISHVDCYFFMSRKEAGLIADTSIFCGRDH